MSLRDDCRWLVDATESMVHGALPTWPRVWSTSTGAFLATSLRLLHRRWFEASLKNMVQSQEIERLKKEVDGLRDTNERLTNMVEKLERAT